jgi:hypothetical protein
MSRFKHRQTKFLVGVFLLAAILGVYAGTGPQTQSAKAASGLRYQRGYSVQNGWLCYGFSDGVYHCTEHWYNSAHGYVSLHTPFVPSERASTPRHATSHATARIASGQNTSGQNTSGQPCHEAVRWPAHITAWTVPLGCYSRIYYPNPSRYPTRPSYGWCNWWPEVLHPWLPGYTALHLPGHQYARVGAVVWFSPGVQGASAAGHYAQVVAIHGSWVLVTEMNFYWRGGGFARVDYRFVHIGPGVTFRYT